MAYQNCLHYAARGPQGDENTPAHTFTQPGWNYYINSGSDALTAPVWTSLAAAIRKLIMATTGWKVPKSTGTLVRKNEIHAAGLGLLAHLAGHAAFMEHTGTEAIPDDAPNSTIVMGDFDNSGGVHFFVKRGGVWEGVPGPGDTVVRSVTISATRFTQNITGGAKNGTIRYWFS